MRTYAELVKEAIRAAYEKSENEYKKFEVGRTYATRSVCNSECIFKITIIKRTEKTVTIDEGESDRNIGDRKSTRLNSSHTDSSRMPSSA